KAKEELGKLAGLSKPDRLETVSISGRRYWRERWVPAPAVAIVGAYGAITSGKSKRDLLGGGRTMGSQTVVKQLKAASKHPGVKAIVFRVDSGGGSALASDEILKEIRRIQEEEKIPVIVSMGNIAGSGGYWISMYGDMIFADPFTITGSIGAAFAKPVIDRLYDKIGVTNEVFKAGEHSDAWSPGRHMTEEEMEFLATLITDTYERFLSNVSKGRKIDTETVKSVAGGKVYFGTTALDLRLIDRLGGLKDAVEYAATHTGIENDYRTIYFRAFPGFLVNVDVRRITLNFRKALGALRPWKDNDFDETLTIF
ncbi:MAG: signal peptide peptidase SppA, partial [bacterium]